MATAPRSFSQAIAASMRASSISCTSMPGPDACEQRHRQLAAEVLAELPQALQDRKAAVGPA